MASLSRTSLGTETEPHYVVIMMVRQIDFNIYNTVSTFYTVFFSISLPVLPLFSSGEGGAQLHY